MFEDLDDRRVPLWMLMGNYSLGSWGPASSLTVEGFWVPGPLDAHVAPWAPPGTPYEVPLAHMIYRLLRVHTPDRNMSDSRWGVRLQGLIRNQINVTVAHMKTFPDVLTTHTVVTPDLPLLVDANDVYLEGVYRPFHITGGSMSFFEPHTNAVFRSEVACFWDEPVFIREENLNILFPSATPVIPLPKEVMQYLGEQWDLNLWGLGLSGLPIRPRTAPIPRKDILRYMVGTDKQVWIRPLNPTTMFFISLQYFGQWVPDFDSRMRQPVNLALKDGDNSKELFGILQFASVRRFEHAFTAIVNTSFRNGTLIPQVATAYDVRGVWLIQPSITWIREPFRVLVQYSAINGQRANFGVFRDRDQVSVAVSYLLN